MVQNLTGKAISPYSIELDWRPPSKVGITQYKVILQTSLYYLTVVKIRYDPLE